MAAQVVAMLVIKPNKLNKAVDLKYNLCLQWKGYV